jgi:chromosome segregation ATPase
VTISDVLKMFSLPPANVRIEEALGKIEGKLGEINEKLDKRGDEAKLKKTLEKLEAQGRDLNARLLNLDARLKVQEEETTSTSGFVFQSYPGVCLRV